MFAIIYPLCFWISFKDPLKHYFHRFHLGLPTIVSGILFTYLILKDWTTVALYPLLIWFFLLFFVACFYWNQPYPNPVIVTVPSIFGAYAYVQIQSDLINPLYSLMNVSFLSGFILCSALFAMNLGHWYLNVHGLPISHLKRATFTLTLFLSIRLAYDIAKLISQQTLYQGEWITYLMFSLKNDGVLIWIGLIFGTLFPLIAVIFVFGTLNLKNTQSATGILYVILASVLLGDLAYKYYWIKFGIYL